MIEVKSRKSVWRFEVSANWGEGDSYTFDVLWETDQTVLRGVLSEFEGAFGRVASREGELSVRLVGAIDTLRTPFSEWAVVGVSQEGHQTDQDIPLYRAETVAETNRVSEAQSLVDLSSSLRVGLMKALGERVDEAPRVSVTTATVEDLQEIQNAARGEIMACLGLLPKLMSGDPTALADRIKVAHKQLLRFLPVVEAEKSRSVVWTPQIGEESLEGAVASLEELARKLTGRL